MKKCICILLLAVMTFTACNKTSISSTKKNEESIKDTSEGTNVEIKKEISKEQSKDKLSDRIVSIREYAQENGLEYKEGWIDIYDGDYIIEGSKYATLTNKDTKMQIVLSLYGDEIELEEIARECYSHSEYYDTTKGYIIIDAKDSKKDCIRCELKYTRDGVLDSAAFGCDETFSEDSVENVSNPFRDDGDGHYNMITRSWMSQDELKAMYEEGLEFAHKINELVR